MIQPSHIVTAAVRARQALFVAAFGVVVGACSGVAASIAAIPPVACLALPLLAVLGLRSTPWAVPFVSVLSFHLAGTRDLFRAAHAFFPDPSAAWMANLGLAIICAVLAAIWTAAARATGRVGITPAIGIGLALVVTLLPPLGAFAVLHPVHAFGFVWPRGGWLAIVLLAGGIAWGAAGLARKNPWFPAGAVVALLAVVPFSATEPNAARGNDRFRSVITSWPDKQLSVEQRIDRITKVGRVVRALAPLNVNWIVFPESAVHPAPGGDYLLGLETGSGAPRPTVWVGMSEGPSGSVAAPVVRIYRPDGTVQDVRARQPMPLSLWRPWDSDAPHARWSSPGLVQSPVGPAYLSFCYEDLVPGPFLFSAVLEGRPNIIVSVANNSFLPSSDAVQAQAWRIENMSRLFGLPLLRAVNLPAATGQAAARRGDGEADEAP
ncbi:MAG: hypothetical protein HYX47_13190 [Burkholderiales bacterium]|nr:hypothetical protein [Burkholderiales bacterium]